MLWVLFLAHVAAVPVAAAVGRNSMRAALLTAATAPAATALWGAVELAVGGGPAAGELVWVEGLDVAIRFRADSLALMMTLLVAGVGALVMVYSAGYFGRDAAGTTRFPATMLAFSTSMLGLVWADSIWTLFIFWELTSVTSFLLVGHKHVDASVRLAARRALAITAGGGLVLLAGLIVMAESSDSSTLTAMGPVSGGAAATAGVLILIGAATKSAQVPFHVWLPGAMAAPTPVSAYLHSAAMVKAGILLIAVVGPAFAGVAVWKWLGIAFGVASLLWGAVGALRHRDAKLILAWGTVSQLGLMVTLLSAGTAKALVAALSLLFTHALFKAALFLLVGEVDVRTGTRDIGELGGLFRSMPVAFAAAVLAGGSMVGLPPLLGFVAKETAIEAVLALTGPEQAVVAASVIAGSVLTVAYTVRLLHGVFGPGPSTRVVPGSLLMTVPAAALSAAGVVGYAALSGVNRIVVPAAAELSDKADAYSLVQWPGLKTAFVVSLLILVMGGGAGLFWASQGARRVPAPVGARAADGMIEATLGFSPRLSAWVQHGSLPVYLAVMGLVAVAAAAALATEFSVGHLIWWDNPVQAALAVTVVGAALAGAFVGSRLGAALALGAVGFGVTGLFLVHGAPDLALTQLLVETVVVVGFVLGLGHLARRFPPIKHTWRSVRIAIAAAGGIAVAAALAASGSAPSGRPPVDALVAGAAGEGGGKNVVNVILTDIRALDTLGEVVVLAVAAIGILALAKTRAQGADPS